MHGRNDNYWLGKRVIVSGGTSGLGLGLVKHLTRRGADVFVFARSGSKLEEVKDMYGVAGITADISKKNDVHRIAASAFTALGGVDVIFNNASTLGKTPLELLLDTDCEDLEHVLQTNLVGPFRLLKELLPRMILGGSGVVVSISSDAAVSVYENWGSYSVSKAALDHMTRILSKEVESVKFYALDPGDMYTPMHLAADPSASKDDLLDPEEVAKAMLTFVSTESSGVRFSSEEWRDFI